MKGFTLYSFIRIALKHILILILSGLIFAVGTFAYCEFVATPVYQASGSLIVTTGTIIVENEDEKLNNTDIVASLNLSDTVIDILKTKEIYKTLSNNMGNKYSYQNLRSRAAISSSDNHSLFITVSFTADNPQEAIDLVNGYLKLAPDYISGYVPGTTSAAITEADRASQTFPRTIIFSLAAAVIGAAIAYVIILLIYSTNTIIRSDEDFRERFDIEILGAIPDFARAKQDKYYYKSYYYGKGGNDNGK